MGKKVLGNSEIFVEEYAAFCRVPSTYSHFLPRILFSELAYFFITPSQIHCVTCSAQFPFITDST